MFGRGTPHLTNYKVTKKIQNSKFKIQNFSQSSVVGCRKNKRVESKLSTLYLSIEVILIIVGYADIDHIANFELSGDGDKNLLIHLGAVVL